ncbi:hypothetical protein ACF3NT_05625 [Naumannella halotolerans]|uniref:Uncharacterized protein n=1 Tax=Naumannella halotolerans TaxID=993414 RepID=A0A4R7JAE7_9ACTN|nr:hypothetical protein [Naumannella halotolerans]TDT33523.1 hypothetical protein CLV29_1141 [Naumannella halotolerans]
MTSSGSVITLVLACLVMLAVIVFMIWILRKLVTRWLERNSRP